MVDSSMSLATLDLPLDVDALRALTLALHADSGEAAPRFRDDCAP